jgi:membrane dipeptidase
VPRDLTTDECVPDIRLRELFLGDVVNPTGMRTLGDFPNLTAAMEHEGWPETKIRKIMGENWLRLLADVWGE